MTQIQLDERDFSKLMTVLLHGVRRNPRRQVLVCACGRRSDSLECNPKAWNGWQIVPFAKCPCCLEPRKEGDQ